MKVRVFRDPCHDTKRVTSRNGRRHTIKLFFSTPLTAWAGGHHSLEGHRTSCSPPQHAPMVRAPTLQRTQLMCYGSYFKTLPYILENLATPLLLAIWEQGQTLSTDLQYTTVKICRCHQHLMTGLDLQFWHHLYHLGSL